MKNMDDLLKKSLTPNKEPDFRTNQSILTKIKEAKPMKKTYQKKFAAVAASCALALAIGSVSVYAAWKYLKPNEAIYEISSEEEKLKEAFSEENAVYVNETQSYQDYDVTLLGITSGKNLTNYKFFSSDSSVTSFDLKNSDDPAEDLLERGFVELNDRSYVLFAIENKNQAFETVDDYFKSPLNIVPIVEGYDYETYQGLFENGSGGRAFLKDGVIYYMYECNNLEKYADHAIYMCISDDLPTFSEYSYTYDDTFHNIAKNEEYEGVNALFLLPIDPAKADSKAAEADVKAFKEHVKARENEPEEPMRESLKKAFDFVEKITPENINDYATPFTDKEATQTFGPADAQGRISIDTSYLSHSGRSMIIVKEKFPDGVTQFVSSTGVTGENPDTLLVELFTLNKDGTVTLQYYKPNLPK